MLLKLFPFIKPYPLSGTPLDLKGRRICYFEEYIVKHSKNFANSGVPFVQRGRAKRRG